MAGGWARECRKWQVFVAALAVALFIPSSAAAYNFPDPWVWWEGNPQSGCCARLNVQFQTGMASRDIAAWQDAMNGWNASAANVVFVTASSSPLVVSDTINPDLYWDGWTNMPHYKPTCSEPRPSFRCHGWIRAYIHATRTVSLTASQRAGIGMHELGHTLSLDENNAGCFLMRQGWTNRQACGVWSPQPDDVNGANFIY